jgi:hypothetical protein
MKTILLATVATLSLGVGAAFAQGLPAGFHEPAYGSQAFSVAPLSLDFGAAYVVGNAAPTVMFGAPSGSRATRLGSFFAGPRGSETVNGNIGSMATNTLPGSGGEGFLMNNGNVTTTLLLPGRCSGGGYDTEVNQLAPAARSRKGRCVLVVRLDTSKSAYAGSVPRAHGF